MPVTDAAPGDLDRAVACWTAAFANDPITGYLLQVEAAPDGRLARFFSLLARARLSLGMPVLVARGAAGLHGAAMGKGAAPPDWPSPLEKEWSELDRTVPGFDDRAAAYDEIARQGRPAAPHFYLGVIGTDPTRQGQGIGRRLLDAFCDRSAADPLSTGVYLETANPSNVRFYERAGFVEVGQGRLGDATLRCMFLSRGPRDAA